MIDKNKVLLLFSALFLVLFVACEDDDATTDDTTPTPTARLGGRGERKYILEKCLII